jgi:hypothetical protein
MDREKPPMETDLAGGRDAPDKGSTVGIPDEKAKGGELALRTSWLIMAYNPAGAGSGVQIPPLHPI